MGFEVLFSLGIREFFNKKHQKPSKVVLQPQGLEVFWGLGNNRLRGFSVGGAVPSSGVMCCPTSQCLGQRFYRRFQWENHGKTMGKYSKLWENAV